MNTQKCNCDGCPKQMNCEYGYVVYDDITKEKMSLSNKFMMLQAFENCESTNKSSIATIEELHNKKLLLKLDLSTLENTLAYLLEQKENYLAVGKCGKAYFNFMKMGDEISLVKEAIREYDEYQVILKQKDLVRSYVLDRVSKERKFQQEEIYKMFSDVERKNVTDTVREMEKSGLIVREKYGKTYIIRKNNA